MDAMNRCEILRLVFAIIISPLVPIIGFCVAMWANNGSNWFPITLLFGYLFFFLFGLPTIGILLKKRSAISCFVGGGSVTIAPILLLSLFSLPSSNGLFDGKMLFELGLLFVAGGVGGIVFWVIAFLSVKPTL